VGIVRVQKNTNYVVLNKTALRDENLSWKSKGIIAYMLSMPDDWIFYIEELVNHATDGESSFRTGFQELKDNGYVKRYPIRGEHNKIIKWETVVSEIPHSEKPLVEKPHVENLDVENRRLLSNDLELSNEEPNNDDIYTLYDFWNKSNIIKHRKLTPIMKRHAKARLEEYSIDELKKSVSNYKDVLEGEQYYWTHKWTFQEFIKPGNIVRFLDEAEPNKNFLSQKAQKAKADLPKDDGYDYGF